MARTNKQGLDYFPHDCNIDDQLEYIVALHESDGYYVYFRLLEKIYSQEGYYMLADKKNLTLFAKKINVDINRINAIINDCYCEHLFDKRLHEKYKILTSKGIQDRFFEATERRKTINVFKEYIISNNDSIKRENVNINPLNVDINPQSKVKYSKGNKSKVKYSIPEAKNASEYQGFVNKWLKFYSYKTGNSFAFDAVSGKSLKSIITKLDKMIKAANSNDSPIELFHLILAKWDILSVWQQENLLDLKVFNSKFNLIINRLKNESGSTETWINVLNKYQQ